jgi:hypothetical protein
VADLNVIGLEWLIGLAEKGDGEMLAAELETYLNNESTRAELLAWLRTVVAGKKRLKPPRARPYLKERRRHIRERWVLMCVRDEMGRKRNTAERDMLIDKFSKLFGTTPPAVADYLKTRKSRRR